MQFGGARPNRGAEVAAVLIEAFKLARDFLRAAGLWCPSEALGDGVSQQSLGEAQAAAEIHLVDGADRHQVVAQLYRSAGPVDGLCQSQ